MKAAKIQDFYKLKSWCDAKDRFGVWRVGRIKRRAKNIITVHFDGWSDKYKETYCLHSSLIAPFRMHSRGYTGQPKKALRDWDFSEDSIKTSEGIITILVHGKFSGLPPHELTNFLRGDLYIQVDSLLSHIYSNPTKEVSRVVEFFKLIIEMIGKYLSIIPIELKNCDLESPEKYLTSGSDALYKALYEIMDLLNMIFGFVPRTAGFYEKYKTLVSPKMFIQSFLKEGMQNFINLLKTVCLEHIWHVVVNLPAVFSTATAGANERCIIPLTQSIINQFECLTAEATDLIVENKEQIDRFILNMENMIELRVSPHEKENYMDFFRRFFKLKPGLSGSLNEGSIDYGRLAFITSPRNKPPAFPTPKNRGKLTLPPKRTETFRSESLDTNEPTQLIVVKEFIEKKHQECVRIIEEKLGERRNTQEQLEKVFCKEYNCDQQEFALLNTIEVMLSSGKIEEAAKIIRWRKQILKIAAVSGSEVAEEVAQKTLMRLDVGASELLEASIKSNIS